jgi:hypothetical protein
MLKSIVPGYYSDMVKYLKRIHTRTIYQVKDDQSMKLIEDNIDNINAKLETYINQINTDENTGIKIPKYSAFIRFIDRHIWDEYSNLKNAIFLDIVRVTYSN